MKIGNANMKPPPEMVEVISLPKTCHRHVFASQRQRIVALAVKIGNANIKPRPKGRGFYYSLVIVSSLPKTYHWHVFATRRQRIVALVVKPGNANTKPPPEMEISIF